MKVERERRHNTSRERVEKHKKQTKFTWNATIGED